MYCKVKSAANIGIEGYIVDVEVHIANGLPRFKIVGLPDKAVMEAKERVTAAIKSSGHTFPLKRITVNLAPSSITKHGPSFDLPIALGILVASGQIRQHPKLDLDKTAFCGELSLNGKLNRTKGIPVLVQTAIEKKIAVTVIPQKNSAEISALFCSKVLLARHITECTAFIKSSKKLPHPTRNRNSNYHAQSRENLQFNQIRGNSVAKRAAIIALAGRHNLSLVGNPGCGKTMLARSLMDLLPTMNPQEYLETQKIYSISDEGVQTNSRARTNQIMRPFRSPHHTATKISIIGGGSIPRPGEITLAHNGILFLDEFPLFSRTIINSLRQPLEDGVINISRKFGKVKFPSKPILITAMNPCPCGNLGHPQNECTCSSNEITRYRNKIPNAIWDRIDLHVKMEPESYQNLTDQTEDSPTYFHKLIDNTWQIQNKRGTPNNAISLNDAKELCPMSKKAEKILKKSYARLGISTRGLIQTVRVARTIADLENKETIGEKHMIEALSFRKKTSS